MPGGRYGGKAGRPSPAPQNKTLAPERQMGAYQPPFPIPTDSGPFPLPVQTTAKIGSAAAQGVQPLVSNGGGFAYLAVVSEIVGHAALACSWVFSFELAAARMQVCSGAGDLRSARDQRQGRAPGFCEIADCQHGMSRRALVMC